MSPGNGIQSAYDLLVDPIHNKNGLTIITIVTVHIFINPKSLNKI